jgi:TatD DNase family protein
VKDPEYDMRILPSRATLVDTHCHLDMSDFEDDLANVLDRARDQGVESIITIGIDLASSRRAIKLARLHSYIWAAIGIHPHDVHSATDATYATLEALIAANRDLIVGYGEIGLDYVKKRSEPKLQRQHFKRQLEMAKKLRLPVIIHDRDAHTDTLDILKECGPFPRGGVMHCFSGNLEFAEKIIDLGFFISIPGIVTFNNAHDLHDIARMVPITSLLVETDAPFLAPHPRRGERNEPSFVAHTAACIARLRNIPLAELAHATTANAASLFQFAPHEPRHSTPRS